MNNKGFTLIELVVVIVILGILAVTAVPKYINLKADAQTATLEGVKAAMQSAAALVYSKSLVKGNQGLSTATITLTDGTELDITYGYPKSVFAGDWKRILNLNSDDFFIITNSENSVLISPASEGFFFNKDSDCIVTYKEATAANKPFFSVTPCV